MRMRPSWRATEWAVLVLAALAAAWGVVVQFATGAGSSAFHFATAPAFIIIVLTIVHMWARRSGVPWSSRYLALFSLVMGVLIAMGGFLAREPPAYSWGELVIGALIVAATGYEAFVSWPSREGQRPLDPRTNV
jgi:peptidoglycan/LPS O-acetylase OafA/YrhL